MAGYLLVMAVPIVCWQCCGALIPPGFFFFFPASSHIGSVLPCKCGLHGNRGLLAAGIQFVCLCVAHH